MKCRQKGWCLERKGKHGSVGWACLGRPRVLVRQPRSPAGPGQTPKRSGPGARSCKTCFSLLTTLPHRQAPAGPGLTGKGEQIGLWEAHGYGTLAAVGSPGPPHLPSFSKWEAVEQTQAHWEEEWGQCWPREAWWLLQVPGCSCTVEGQALTAVL